MMVVNINGWNVASEYERVLAYHVKTRMITHDQIHQEMWHDLQISSDPRQLWSYLERIGAVTHPPCNREWEWEHDRM